MKGIIFDIQKFALHDGPGIRTTVFLKGCPLSCKWCSNPEAILVSPQLSFYKDRCKDCLDCVEVCDTGALIDSNGKLIVDFHKCNACGDCVNLCDEKALNIFGYEISAEEVVNEVVKDKLYFQKSGGGITLSGGDALLQYDFAKEILKLSKEYGISTCLQTEGYSPTEKFKEILPYVDHFLFDYKIGDSELHRRYTGVSNDLILKNLDFLLKNNTRVILRCVIIPGINNTSKHFNSIAQLYFKYENIDKIEIIPYHNYGEKKYELIDKEYSFDIKTVSDQETNKWITALEQLGIERINKG